ncbi:MAG: hypothetical protein KY455_10150 [Euryarchaeota archaeon]|nr:hypothetical protein [Euryarchaeota archaeon]
MAHTEFEVIGGGVSGPYNSRGYRRGQQQIGFLLPFASPIPDAAIHDRLSRIPRDATLMGTEIYDPTGKTEERDPNNTLSMGGGFFAHTGYQHTIWRTPETMLGEMRSEPGRFTGTNTPPAPKPTREQRIQAFQVGMTWPQFWETKHYIDRFSAVQDNIDKLFLAAHPAPAAPKAKVTPTPTAQPAPPAPPASTTTTTSTTRSSPATTSTPATTAEGPTETPASPNVAIVTYVAIIVAVVAIGRNA